MKIEDFWNNVDRSGDSDLCWEWQRGRDKAGYGRVTIDGQNQMAHRVAWVLTNGPIPAGLLICHHCDNPPCCNPQHLFSGTPGGNTYDRICKGRFIPAAGHSILPVLPVISNLDMHKIRQWYRIGASPRRLAQEYDVDEHEIQRVIDHKPPYNHW